MATVEKVIAILKEMDPSLEVSEHTDLFDTGAIDSFTIFSELLPTLQDTFDFTVEPIDLVPENFTTPAQITDYINRKLG